MNSLCWPVVQPGSPSHEDSPTGGASHNKSSKSDTKKELSQTDTSPTNEEEDHLPLFTEPVTSITSALGMLLMLHLYT